MENSMLWLLWGTKLPFVDQLKMVSFRSKKPSPGFTHWPSPAGAMVRWVFHWGLNPT